MCTGKDDGEVSYLDDIRDFAAGYLFDWNSVMKSMRCGDFFIGCMDVLKKNIKLPQVQRVQFHR